MLPECPVLIVFSGLPGTGKTTLARELARRLGAVYLRIDSIEQALRAAGCRVEGEGYAAAHALAEDNLRLGRTVIADCVNPWPLTRAAWQAVGAGAGARVVDVEVVCSDTAEHRRRVESRVADIPGHRLPTWDEVLKRDYRAWEGNRLVLDTSACTVEESIVRILGVTRDPSRPSTGSSGERLVAAILEFLAVGDLLTQAEIRAALDEEIDRAGPSAVLALKARLVADEGWGYSPRDPLAARIHERLADRFLSEDSSIEGASHLDAPGGAPVVLVANHLSYADANVVHVLLHRAGASSLADRLTALAGPKIFSSRERRFSSLCFGTIKVPQSAEVSSEEAVLPPRAVARAARQAIEAAQDRLRRGDALLLFAEGTRSRIGAMRPMLAGAARYLDLPATRVLTVGLTGSESLLPVGDGRMRPARVTVSVGAPLDAGRLRTAARGERRLMMDAIGLAVAELVPLQYRGVYARPADFGAALAVLRLARDADPTPAI